MKTETIVELINEDFGKHKYRGAAGIVDSGELWNELISVVSDAKRMNFIKEANDLLGVPPTKCFLLYYRKDKGDDVKIEDTTTRQSVGAFWGYVFQDVLNYKDKKDRVPVNLCNIKTATRFMDGDDVFFTE